MGVLVLIVNVVTGGKQSQILFRPTKVESASSEWSLTKSRKMFVLKGVLSSKQ